MTFLGLVARQLVRLGQAVGFYLCAVTVTPLIAMILMAFVGYLPYSDRPGPGWYGLRLAISVRELRLFVDWWVFSALAAIPLAAVLFVLDSLLSLVRKPRWLRMTASGTASLLLSGYLLLATGWYIAISGVIPILGGLAGFIHGAWVLSRLPIPVRTSSGVLSWSRLGVGGVVPALVIALAALIPTLPRPRPEQAAALVVIGCSLTHEELSEKAGALTAGEADELRRLGLMGPLGVVAIITPWSAGRATGTLPPLPIGEPSRGSPRTGPRTVIVTRRLPTAALEVDVAFDASALYVHRDAEWTTIPATVTTSRRARISPIRDAPGNVTLELEGVSMGTSFRYCP